MLSSQPALPLSLKRPTLQSVVYSSSADVAVTVDHSTDECCSDTFLCSLCSAGVSVLLDQFKVEQSNSLKYVMTGLRNDLRDARQEKHDLEPTTEQNTRKIKPLEDRLSKCSFPPSANNQTGMQSPKPWLGIKLLLLFFCCKGLAAKELSRLHSSRLSSKHHEELGESASLMQKKKM